MKKVTDELMRGNILDALKHSKVDPSHDSKMVGEILSIILEDEKLKIAFSKACLDAKSSPKKIAKRAIRYWLTEKGYYE